MLLEAGWIEPEDSTVSEIIETQTNKFCMFSLTCGNMNFDFIEIEQKTGYLSLCMIEGEKYRQKLDNKYQNAITKE